MRKITEAEAKLLNAGKWPVKPGVNVADKRKFWQEDVQSFLTTGLVSSVLWEVQIVQACNYHCKHCLHMTTDRYDSHTLAIDKVLAYDRAQMANTAITDYTEAFSVKHNSVTFMGGEISLLPKEMVRDIIDMVNPPNLYEKVLYTNLSQPYEYYDFLTKHVSRMDCSFHDSQVKNYQQFFTKVARLATTLPLRVHMTFDASNQKLLPYVVQLAETLNFNFTNSLLLYNKDTTKEGRLGAGWWRFQNEQSFDCSTSNGVEDFTSVLRSSTKCSSWQQSKGIWLHNNAMVVAANPCPGPRYSTSLINYNKEDFINSMKTFDGCDHLCTFCKEAVCTN